MSIDLTVKRAVIPVAGFGTRFLPATKAMPKEMLNIVDKPVIQYIVEEALGAGIKEIIFITGRGKRALEDHFDYNYELEHLLKQKGKTEQLAQIRRISEMVKVTYIRQKEALGLGHAILQARSLVGREPFAVFLGDDIIRAKTPVMGQMLRVFERYKKSIVAVRRAPRDELRSYGVVDAERINDRVGRVKQIVEKPEPGQAPSDLAVSGRYVLTPEVFDFLAKARPGKGGEIQITDSLAALAGGEGLLAYRYEGRYYDGGNKLELIKATIDFALERPDFRDELKKFLRDKTKNTPIQ